MERLKEPEFFLKTRDILDRYPKENGRFYCGCSKNVTKLLPSEITGEIRSGEEERRGFRDVIFLTKNFQKANEYAGSEGVIFEVKTDAVQYKLVAIDVLNPKKGKSVGKDIYIALPEDIKIIVKWHKEKNRKRGEPLKYITEYIGE